MNKYKIVKKEKYRSMKATINQLKVDLDAALLAQRRLRDNLPSWTKGYSSDSVAAQVTQSALDEIYSCLGVTSQTGAILQISHLTHVRNIQKEYRKPEGDSPI